MLSGLKLGELCEHYLEPSLSTSVRLLLNLRVSGWGKWEHTVADYQERSPGVLINEALYPDCVVPKHHQNERNTYNQCTVPRSTPAMPNILGMAIRALLESSATSNSFWCRTSRVEWPAQFTSLHQRRMLVSHSAHCQVYDLTTTNDVIIRSQSWHPANNTLLGSCYG